MPAAKRRPEDVAYSAASWALGVEYVDDLKRPPVQDELLPAVGLPRPVIDACRNLASHLREHHRDFYQRTADETEGLLAKEIKEAQASDLGKIDTFRFEEDKVLLAALESLSGTRWDEAAEWAELRVEKRPDQSFWLRDDPARQSAWRLILSVARLGQAMSRAGALASLGTAQEDEGLDGAVRAYVERGAAVDQAHRQMEQHRVALLYPQVPGFESLRQRLDEARVLWREWADGWAREFSALCRARGFLPSPSLQQRHLFDEVVRPMCQEPGVTALFVVDALRYEMAEELYQALSDTPATSIHLKARLAELPTLTAVGMNALAPVTTAKARLLPVMDRDSGAISGFSSTELRVTDPESRRRAMHDRVGGVTCPWHTLEEVTARDANWLKRSVSQARLVVVHSLEIDQAGENGVGPAVFAHILQKLKAAWRLLRDAGVRRFVITSDHGFLLLDGASTAQPHGRRIDPKRRHVYVTVPADHTGEARVSLSELGYEGEGFLCFPESTAVFDTGKRPMSFVHGGNSLQERVIPVLTLVHRAAAGG
ncbi:MAG TPA: BREX-6 system phosphatase PglZ, partial [Myxococcota bacterium]|nr:BREX-6 system phosphatase PglZ [Myxococcota bacterium]